MIDIKDLNYQEIKLYSENELKNYMTIQREQLRDDMRVYGDTIVSINEKLERIESKLDRHDVMLWKHENQINHLMSEK